MASAPVVWPLAPPCADTGSRGDVWRDEPAELPLEDVAVVVVVPADDAVAAAAAAAAVVIAAVVEVELEIVPVDAATVVGRDDSEVDGGTTPSRDDDDVTCESPRLCRRSEGVLENAWLP